MSLNRYAKSRDDNEKDIVDALELIPGVSVERLDRPADLLVGTLSPCRKCGDWDRRTYLLEVKAPAGPRGGKSGHSRGPSESQKRFRASWRGHYVEVHTAQEALEAIGKGVR